MAEQTHQEHIVNADSIFINNKDDRKSSHIQIGTAGSLGDNDLVLNNCNVRIDSGGYVKAPQIRTLEIKDTSGNNAITLSGGNTIDFNVVNIDFNNANLINMASISASQVSSANGYASLDAELDALQSQKISITGHTANKIFVSTSGGGITTGTINPADITSALTKTNNITVSQAVDLDAIETNSNASKVITDYISVSQVVDLDAIETNSNASKVKTDLITISSGVNLNTMNSSISTNAGNISTNSIMAMANSSSISNIETKTDWISITQTVDLDAIESTANSALQNFNGLSTNTITVGGGADKTANVDFKMVGTAMNISPLSWKYLTLRTPTLTADKIVVLPSDAGTLQLVNGSGDIITTAERNLITTNQTNITTKLNHTFTGAGVGGYLLQTNASGQIIESGAVYNDVIVSLGSYATRLNNIETKTDDITITQEVNLDTMESGISTNASGIGTNLSNILVNAATNASQTLLIAANTVLAGNALPASSVIDEDNMASNSNSKVPTQQSTRAYVDAKRTEILGYIASNDTELARLNTHFTTTLVSERWFVKNNKIGCLGPIATVANNTTVINESNLFFDTSDGSLPGQPTSTNYPTIKTNYTTLYFSVSNQYTAYMKQLAGGIFQVNFTGQHQTLPVNEDLYNNVDDYVGKIVISNGDLSSFIINEDGSSGISSGKRGIHINEAMPRVVLCNTYKDKRIFGVISNEEEDNETANMPTRATEKHFRQGAFVSVMSGLPADDNRIFINSLGEGAIWVINSHGNIENGDYICSSDKGEGYGCLQDDDLLHNYTCAKATINCSFDLESEEYECKEILVNGENLRIAFIACVYNF